MNERPAKEIPVIGLQMDLQFGDKTPRVLRAQTHIVSDATPAEIDALLDKIATAQDRQAARYRLEEKRESFLTLIDIIKRFEGDVVRLDEEAQIEWEASNRKGDFDPDKNMPVKKKQERASAFNQIHSHREKAKSLQEEIRKLEAIVGTRTAVGGADHHTGDAERQDARNGGASGATA